MSTKTWCGISIVIAVFNAAIWNMGPLGASPLNLLLSAGCTGVALSYLSRLKER